MDFEWTKADNDTAPDVSPAGGFDRDFDDAVLGALAEMAIRSTRRQADLDIAVRRAGLHAARPQVNAALRRLEHDGCLETLVPLADGGLLLSVTARGIERLSQTARRYIVNGD